MSAPGTAVMNPVGPTGSAGVNWRGAWASGSTYNLHDGVTRNGASYVALANGLTGSGTDPATDVTDWLQIAAAGTAALGFSSAVATAGNDSRVMNPDPPAANGFTAMTLRAREATSTSRPATGTLILQKLWLPSPATITNVYTVFAAAGSLNQTGFFMGLYDSSGNLLRGSADQHTVSNAVSTGLVTIPLSSSFSWAGGANAYLYVAYLAIGGTTTPALAATGTNPLMVNANIAAAASQTQQLGGQASLPATVTLGSNILTVGLWMAVS